MKKMPKSNRVTPVDVRTINNVAIESKKVVDTEQTKILKIVCICVAISTVASTATFAAIISNQVILNIFFNCRVQAYMYMYLGIDLLTVNIWYRQTKLLRAQISPLHVFKPIDPSFFGTIL